ncbi:ArsR/SmtB family transcription factor [Qipengyuania psychrotolerans]|uniref:Metalloregulator ArsR/SmtB family transcription factor n=1 Tax=Qipengyuania psychrotolerans TaxID=2867238 RepID=A0ABX8ZGX4_9SPHN|nr:metalloregulator ArsR/SmtB family transcription factor [Qipengyuania psychrotolerans]QZD86523.1 metalloregulator ArsR/SmtB family transcription factor [Qipengyuania psychrotolerans]
MTDEEFVDALKALAHPVRLRIMRALTGVERNVGEIDETAEIGQPTLSQQLAVLRNAGLVTTRKDAKLVYYRIDEGRLAKVTAATGELGGMSAGVVRYSRQPAPGVANFAKLT